MIDIIIEKAIDDIQCQENHVKLVIDLKGETVGSVRALRTLDRMKKNFKLWRSY